MKTFLGKINTFHKQSGGFLWGMLVGPTSADRQG
jgi:hypothetical protein